MSLETWKAEFYQIDAHEVAAKDAIQHSLTKWIGLRQENVNKHNLIIGNCEISDIDNNKFSIDSTTCSLCEYYCNPYNKCKTCPIVEYKSTKSIYKDRTCCEIEFIAFEYEHDPEPMINLLQGVLNTQQTVL